VGSPPGTATHAFVGLRRCGHAEFLYVDLPDREGREERDSMLDGFVECLRAGGSIKRITIAEASLRAVEVRRVRAVGERTVRICDLCPLMPKPLPRALARPKKKRRA
jgi:hypothetical protein